MLQPRKVEAIYSLRDAAEQKAMAEMILRDQPNEGHRDALLEAQLRLEAKTQDAIEACHECGGSHAKDQPHVDRGDNVIRGKFGDEDEP
jgi:hypothetical protein